VISWSITYLTQPEEKHLGVKAGNNTTILSGKLL